MIGIFITYLPEYLTCSTKCHCSKLEFLSYWRKSFSFL